MRAWYAESSAGAVLQGLEGDYLSSAVGVGPGKNLVQLGVYGWEARYLEGGARCVWVVESDAAASPPRGIGRIRAEFSHLPLPAESVDVLVMPHILEFELERHSLLREIDRVLKPEGHLHLLGFNPASFRGWWRPSGRAWMHWGCVSMGQVLDWLSLLQYSVEWRAGLSCALGRTAYPCRSLGENLIASFSSVYALHAIKRTRRYTPLYATEPALCAELLPQAALGTAHASRP